MKPLFPALFLLLLTGCAETVLYNSDGKIIARFQGDMTKSHFVWTKEKVEWTTDAVSHSVPTEAQGKAASAKITAIGGVVGATAAAATAAAALVP